MSEIMQVLVKIIKQKLDKIKVGNKSIEPKEILPSIDLFYCAQENVHDLFDDLTTITFQARYRAIKGEGT